MSLAQDIKRVVAPFEVVSEYSPAGDQPTAIKELAERIQAGEKDVVLMGATGTGKSATTAWLVEQVQRPTLVMVQNKTLAAQLANEFRELLPNNAVEYFVSYYDYYQPEAYVPQTDTFIEKDSSINEEVERLRHSATNALLTRRDVIVVATVSCIYGLGTPEEYIQGMVTLRRGMEMNRDDLLRKFVSMQYVRNDMDFHRGTFRVRGDTVEIIPMYEEQAIRIEFFGDEIESIQTLHPLTGDLIRDEQEMYVFPASHYVAGPERMNRAIKGIEDELRERLAELEGQNKLLEAQRLRMRTTYDLEMMQQMGFCNGIENYSRWIDGRGPGTAPHARPRRGQALPRAFAAAGGKSRARRARHTAVPSASTALSNAAARAAPRRRVRRAAHPLPDDRLRRGACADPRLRPRGRRFAHAGGHRFPHPAAGHHDRDARHRTACRRARAAHGFLLRRHQRPHAIYACS